MKPVWVVDDDASIRWVLEKALGRAQLPVRLFETANDAMRALQEDTPQVLVSDIRMPGDSGLELLEKVKARLPDLPVIIMTGFSDLDSAVNAFQGGAFEYLPKPFDIDVATALIQRAVKESSGDAAARPPTVEVPLEMLGQAPAMQEVFRAIGRLSQSSATVLITGESGSGKELVANALHRHSPRADRPFVALNTAAIPHDLLESELFGHERGSFTGAQATRKGRFEQADGGTLFLDEIGDMPLDLQTRLLRVLSDGQYYRVGGQQALKANVRVIAATHQNLEQRVAEGKFREDLFHRLNVIRLRLPALRERREDIAGLVQHFLMRSAKSLSVEPKHLSAEALALVQQHPFPGNVRQLENLCHWITVMAPSNLVAAADLPPEFRSMTALSGGLTSVISSFSSESAGRVPVVEPSAGHGSQSANGTAHAAALQPLSAQGSAGGSDWRELLRAELVSAIRSGQQDGQLFDRLSDDFERVVYGTALEKTRGKRLEAASLLGVGRNTITRKIQELSLEGEPQIRSDFGGLANR
ncbi:MAG: nitrogen regulation protein NR(I) [Burkholderiaceae bacterium]